MKAPGKRLRLIALQGGFDSPGQALGQQHGHRHGQQAQQHHLEDGDHRHMGQAAQVESHHHKADDLSRAVSDGGIGRVLRAQGAGFIGGVGSLTGQGQVLCIPGVLSPPQSRVWRINKGVVQISHQNQVDIRGMFRGGVQK